MDLETIYIRTAKGEAEIGNDQLSLELHDILSRIDGKTSLGKMMQDASFWSEQTFESALKELLDGGYIEVPGAREQEGALVEEMRATGKSKFAQSKRTLIASVLFLDIVEYTRQSVSEQFRIKEDFNRLVYGLVQRIPEDDRIIVDTGDGAALGFLADPEEVLFIAIELRDALEANDHKDHPKLHVRMGINLGPVKLVADMNGRENLIGDGVNDANRVMNFAKGDQILVSRSFYDVVSRLSSEHHGLFKYQGIHKDKHRREHEIYEVAGGEKTPAEEMAEEKTEEEIKAERLEKMKAKLEAAAKSEAEAKAAQAARDKAREALEAEMRRKAEARILAEEAQVSGKRHSGIFKAVLIALAVFLVAMAGILPFIPLEFLAKDRAASIADKTQQTVMIESASFSVFPTPRIVLKQVSVGQDLKISRMSEILFPKTIVVEDAVAGQAVLSQIGGWGGFAQKIAMKGVSLTLNGKPLPLFGGEIDLSDDGSFRHALIDSEGMKAEIAPKDSGVEIELSARDWKLPLGPDCPWAEIHARAVADAKALKIVSWDASGYGGEWSGTAAISWGAVWRASGNFKGKNLDIEPLLPYFSKDARIKGTLEFDAEASSSAESFEKLFDQPGINASFLVKDGLVGNADIAQAIQAPSPDGTRGGETKFDTFSGMLVVSGGNYRYDQLKLISGILKASGGFDLRGGKLSGRMEVGLNQMRSPLTLGGTLSDLVIR